MKSEITRRNFISKLGLLSGFIIAGHAINGMPYNTPNSINIDRKHLLGLQIAAREFYNRKEFIKSAEIYKTLILEDKCNISYYDGLKKCYRFTNNEYDILKILREGVENNKDKPEFYVRLAKYYRELFCGNRKYYKTLTNNESDILEQGIYLLKKAIDISPNKKYIYYELLECLYARYRCDYPGVLNKRNKYEILSTYFKKESISTTIINEWLDNKFLPNRKFNPIEDISNEEIKEIADIKKVIRDNVGKKNKRNLYCTKEINQRYKDSEKYYLYLEKKIINDFCKITPIHELYSFALNTVCKDIRYSSGLSITRKRLHKVGDINGLVNINEAWYFMNKNSWSRMALANSLIRNNQLTKAEDLLISYDDISTSNNNKLKCSYFNNKILCYAKKGEIDTSLGILNEAYQQSFNYNGGYLSFLFLYARLTVMKGNHTNGVNILEQAHKTRKYGYIDVTNNNYIIPDLNTQRLFNTTELLKVHYEELKNNILAHKDYQTIIDKILELNPKDQFVTKYIMYKI